MRVCVRWGMQHKHETKRHGAHSKRTYILYTSIQTATAGVCVLDLDTFACEYETNLLSVYVYVSVWFVYIRYALYSTRCFERFPRFVCPLFFFSSFWLQIVVLPRLPLWLFINHRRKKKGKTQLLRTLISNFTVCIVLRRALVVGLMRCSLFAAPTQVCGSVSAVGIGTRNLFEWAWTTHKHTHTLSEINWWRTKCTALWWCQHNNIWNRSGFSGGMMVVLVCPCT